MPTYDDVSDLMTSQEFLANDEEEPKYMHPPPPRPISTTKSLIANNPDNQIEELYDDVNICREQYIKSHNQVMFCNTIANIFITAKIAIFLFSTQFLFFR